MDSELDLAILL